MMFVLFVVTLFLFTPFPPITDLDGAHTNYDSHYEKQDTTNQTSSYGSSFYIFWHGISCKDQMD